MKDVKLGLRDMNYISTMCSDDMLYEDRNIVESYGECEDHASTEYEVDKNTDSSKSLVSDTTQVNTPYNCDTVNVSTPDLTNTVQNTEQATSITQNTEHASEKQVYQTVRRTQMSENNKMLLVIDQNQTRRKS